MKKSIACLLIVALLPSLLLLPAAAAAETDGARAVEMKPLVPRQDVTAALRDCVQRIADMAGEGRSVAAVKELRDYADNLYYVCELQPAGYIIADGSYGTVIEYSPVDHSPYLGQEDSLVYLGASFYYEQQSNGDLQDLYYGDVIDGDSPAFMAAALECSNQLHMAQADCAQSAVELNRSMGLPVDAPISPRPETLVGTQALPQPDAVRAGSKDVYVRNGEKLSNLRTNRSCGHLSNSCGYNAIGLALYWMDECYGLEEAVNDFAFMEKTGDTKSFCGNDLTRELYSYRSVSGGTNGPGSGCQSQEEIINDYAAAHWLNISYKDCYDGSYFDAWFFPYRYSDIKKALINNNMPVILSAKMDPYALDANGGSHQLYPVEPGRENAGGDHTCLVYGYRGDDLIVHMGQGAKNFDLAKVYLTSSNVLKQDSFIALQGCSAKTVPISDVSNPKSWKYTPCQYCARYQILKLNGGKIRPEKNITRGEWVQALYTLAGSPLVDLQAARRTLEQFQDALAAENFLYLAEAAWAVQNGILTGVSSTELGLGQPLTRQQAATFLQRYSNTLSLKYSKTNGPAASSFPDYSQLSSYARTPMDFCTRRYLYKGSKAADGKVYLKPKDTLTRAEAAQLLYNLSQVASR